MRKMIALVAGLLSVVPVSLAAAQSTLQAPVGEMQAYSFDSGVQANPRADEWIVQAEHVRIGGAAWVRVYFGDCQLEDGSYIRITSTRDGERQHLTKSRLAMWSYASAFFNGDTVIVELVAAPGTTNNRLVIDAVLVGAGGNGDRGGCGICDPDDRVPSSDLAACRLWPVGCSATIYNEDSCFVTAGHCLSEPDATVVQFNVPPSEPNCQANNPPVADQFPVVDGTWSDNGLGSDWAVGTLGLNDLGETAFERYGTFRPIATGPVNSGTPIENFGYGLDLEECVNSSVQQHVSGTVLQTTGAFYVISLDATFGQSGSGIIANGQIIGIMTHCSNECSPQQNAGTRADLDAFVEAREMICQNARPANDLCAEALPIFTGQTEYTTINALTEGPIDPDCGLDAIQVTHDVWFRYAASCTGLVTVSTCESDFNNTLSVYGADCPTVDNEAIACDIGSCVDSNRAVVSFLADEGSEYLIRISGRNGQQGSGIVDVICELIPPDNDLCADAFVATEGSNPYTTINALTDGPFEVNCGFPDLNGLTNDVWFRYVATCTGEVTADVCDGDFNNSVVVYEGGCPVGDNEAIACDENGCGTAQASVDFAVTEGVEYWIRISGKNGQTGSGTLVIDCTISEPGCDGDVDVNGIVDVVDLLALLAAWGPCPGGCDADFNGDETVDVNDLLALLGAWGPCPG